MTENEVWKDVLGYEGLYKVSDRGNVRSLDRINHIGSRYSGRILKPRYDRGGYLRVGLCKDGKMKTKFIHRLVLEAFIPNLEKLPEVNHKDENPSNNKLSNLEWCTREHNINHGTRNERVAQAQSKKVRAVNVETGEVVKFNSTREAGRKGYTQGHVAAACRGDYSKGGGNLYKGHKWYYDEDNQP